jgi:hypothetical protein
LRLARGSIAHHLPTDIRQTDPNLAIVVAAWPILPEPIRAGIVAMIKASGPAIARDTNTIRPAHV